MSTLLALAAYLVMTLHFAFLMLVLFGGVASLRFPRLLPIHIPAFAYAFIIEAVRFPCPVTDFEKFLRVKAGLGSYDRGFIGHYIEPHLVHLGVPQIVYANLGYWTVGLNLLLYAYFLYRTLRSRRRGRVTQLVPGASLLLVCLVCLASCSQGPRAAEPTTLPTTRSAGVAFPYRMLAIFAESENDLRLDQQRRLLGPVMPILERQGIRLVEVVGSDPLRDLMHVPEEDFHVVLIERNATSSFRADSPVTPSQFGIILGADPVYRTFTTRPATPALTPPSPTRKGP